MQNNIKHNINGSLSVNLALANILVHYRSIYWIQLTRFDALNEFKFSLFKVSTDKFGFQLAYSEYNGYAMSRVFNENTVVSMLLTIECYQPDDIINHAHPSSHSTL